MNTSMYSYKFIDLRIRKGEFMNSVKLEVLTPHSMFFSGEIEALTVETMGGSEGYLYGHTWCRKLLKKNGKIKIREKGSEGFKVAKVKGGFVEIRDNFTLFAEDAEWVE